MGPDTTDFIGKIVYTELKGQFKTIIPLSTDCKSAGHGTILMRPSDKDKNQHFNECSHEKTHRIKKK